MHDPILWLGVDGWPWAALLAAKTATGKTFLKPIEHYVGEYPFWDAVAWAIQAVDTPCSPRQGYEGILEHVTVRFVARCSRICTHELVRHRLASYSQTSTRLGGFHATGYGEAVLKLCNAFGEAKEEPIPGPGVAPATFFGGLGGREAAGMLAELCVLPPKSLDPDGHDAVVGACLRYFKQVCEYMKHGLAKRVDEALRYSQPDALAAHIMVTTNLREVLYILSMRLHPHAHWEIRGLAQQLADKLWADYKIPAYLMLALKRPGLLTMVPSYRRRAEQELEELQRRLPSEAFSKIVKLYLSSLGKQP